MNGPGSSTHAAFTVLGAFVLVYFGLAWAGFAWALSRVNRRARGIAAALEGAGARVLASRAAAHLWKAAEIEFELGGKRARVEVRQWGRDDHLVSVRIDSPPMPALWIRRERFLDRMGKSLGLTREVQIGDAAFDEAAFIVSPAADAVVREVLEKPEVRRLVLDVVEHGYSVLMSKDGLRAATLTWNLRDADGAADVPGILGLLEKLSAALPRMDPGLASALRIPRSPVVVVLPLMAGCMVLLAVFAMTGRELVHPPIDNKNIAVGLLSGLVLWLPAVYVAARMLKNRPLALLELVFVSVGLLCVVPFAGGFSLFAANSLFDGGPTTHERARVLDYYKRNSHTVWVESWVAGASQQKIIVPAEIPVVSIGDTLEFDVHPGAMGWTWVSGIQRVP